MKTHFVDVWQYCLSPMLSSAAHRMAELSQQERVKAGAFKQELMRQRYILIRAILRQTLATYLNQSPQQLQFAVAEYGKPYLIGQALYFNVSHSRDDLLIAVADFAGIGVDVEVIKCRPHLDGLAQRCLAADELSVWQGLSADEQLLMFYRLWTKKEAFVKAVGRGMGLGLQACEFECQAGGSLRRIPHEYGLAKDWQVMELSLGPAHCAALVTPDLPFVLQHLSGDMLQQTMLGKRVRSAIADDEMIEYPDVE